MKRLLQKIGWVLNRIAKTPGNIAAWIANATTPVVHGRVVCWAYNFKQYSCNPRYLTEYLLKHHPEFEIYWVLRKGFDTSELPEGVKAVRFRTWEYLRLMASAEFLLTNIRTDPWRIYWHKREGQKYAMLWHAGVALKRIEADAADKLSFSYTQRAKADSKVCDLMISGCAMQTKLQRERYWYNGEILERGIPRNDIFFDTARHKELRERIAKQYGIDPKSRIVLYAPTFRVDYSTKPYAINWSRVTPAISRMFGGESVAVLVRMHPLLIGKVETSHLVAYEGVCDATRYHDMQELLAVADMLITDYSSSMFDFAMQGRLCLLYATDANAYDRGFYFNLDELPFPLSESEEQLLDTIANFDNEAYTARLNTFFTERIGLKENGHASQALAKWMIAHRL
ncbi:MAG: CDP-glycerol glycerophosphotransferase family protein [Alistipes sp.]|nr:CDP-glycerol glycerophosphotransferase family protein [Alistipes sp.]